MDDLLDLGDGPNPAYASAPAVSGVAGGLDFGTSAAVAAGQGGGSGDVGAAGGEEDDSLLQALEATAFQATTPNSDPNSRNKSGTIGSLESLMLASDQIKALALPPPPPPPSMGTLGSTT